MEQQKITKEKPEAVKQQNWFFKKLTGKLLSIMIKERKTKQAQVTSETKRKTIWI